jgi:hypothetical protein
MTTATERKHLLPCPLCGETEASIELCLSELPNPNQTDDDLFTCNACGNGFSLSHVRAFVAQWMPILKWLESCPPACGDAPVVPAACLVPNPDESDLPF